MARQRLLTFALIVLFCGGASSLNAQAVEERTAVHQPSLADSVLTQDVWRIIQVYEMAGGASANCAQPAELGKRVIAEAPAKADPRNNPWVEHWTVRRCQNEAVYRVVFTPSRGGTQYQVSPLKPDS